MTSYRAVLPLAFTLCGALLLISPAHAGVYPSAGAFWVGGAGPYNPTDPQTIQDGLVTWQDVQRWEATHADFAAWTGLQYRQYVPSMIVLDYMYVGALNADGLFVWETDLRKLAVNNSHNFEDYFLHYSQDTWLNVTALYQNDTAWAGVPPAVGYSMSLVDQTGVALPGTGPWSADIFQGVSRGGAFYLADPEKFGEATLTFAPGGTHGTVTIQYASAVDSNFNVTKWKPLTLTSDGTANFTQNGRISWIPPSDWVWGYNQIPQGLEFSRRGYAHWLRITGTGRPILTGLKTRAWVGVDPSGAHQGYVKTPGWDPANDQNGDGYVDDNEYAHLVDPNATARFRYESRLAIINNGIGLGTNWSLSETNTANPLYQQDVAQYYQGHWQSPLINGAYNDNFWIDLNPWIFPVLAGGQLINEGSIQGTVPSAATNLAYSTAFDAVLKGVKQSTGSDWMGTNISNVNPYDYHGWTYPYPSLSQAMLASGAYDWFLLESTLYDDWTMVDVEVNYFAGPGLSRLWQIPAFAKAGLKSGIMTRVGPDLLGLPPFNPSMQAKWERSQSALLAQYYLYHFPGLTYFQSIYYNITDISQLTTTANYYKPGVPSNYAYQPHKMMAVDIGTPTGTIPQSYVPMQYTAAVDGTGQLNNTIVGVSTDTVLNHPVFGQIQVLPTAIYYLLTRSSAPYTRIVYDPQGHPFPAEVVLARQYSKGMVVYRTSYSYPVDQHNNLDYTDYASDANEITVTLPGIYQRLNFDGTRAPPSNQVMLHGFEGAVFVKPSSIP